MTSLQAVTIQSADRLSLVSNGVDQFLRCEDRHMAPPAQDPALDFLSVAKLQLEYRRTVFCFTKSLRLVLSSFADEARGESAELQLMRFFLSPLKTPKLPLRTLLIEKNVEVRTHALTTAPRAQKHSAPPTRHQC